MGINIIDIILLWIVIINQLFLFMCNMSLRNTLLIKRFKWYVREEFFCHNLQLLGFWNFGMRFMMHNLYGIFILIHCSIEYIHLVLLGYCDWLLYFLLNWGMMFLLHNFIGTCGILDAVELLHHLLRQLLFTQCRYQLLSLSLFLFLFQQFQFLFIHMLNN